MVVCLFTSAVSIGQVTRLYSQVSFNSRFCWEFGPSDVFHRRVVRAFTFGSGCVQSGNRGVLECEALVAQSKAPKAAGSA